MSQANATETVSPPAALSCNTICKRTQISYKPTIDSQSIETSDKYHDSYNQYDPFYNTSHYFPANSSIKIKIQFQTTNALNIKNGDSRGHVVADGDQRSPLRPISNETEQRLGVVDLGRVEDIGDDLSEGADGHDHDPAGDPSAVIRSRRPLQRRVRCSNRP